MTMLIRWRVATVSKEDGLNHLEVGATGPSPLGTGAGRLCVWSSNRHWATGERGLLRENDIGQFIIAVGNC
jgi:hypothetical protein